MEQTISKHDILISSILKIPGFTVWYNKEKKRFQILFNHSYTGLLYPGKQTIYLVKTPQTDELKKILENNPDIKGELTITYEPPPEPV